MWGEREDAQEEDLGSARREDASAGMSSFGNAQRVQSTWEIEKQMKETEEKKAKMSDRERKLLEKVRACIPVHGGVVSVYTLLKSSQIDCHLSGMVCDVTCAVETLDGVSNCSRDAVSTD